jgi:hypothetical protein
VELRNNNDQINGRGRKGKREKEKELRTEKGEKKECTCDACSLVFRKIKEG